jgi:kinesin family protein 13
MKIIVCLVVLFAICTNVLSLNSTSTDSGKSTEKLDKKKIQSTNETPTTATVKDSRGKRNLELGTYGESIFQPGISYGHNRHGKSFSSPSSVHFSNRGEYYANNNLPYYSGNVENSYTGYHHNQQPLYLEAPEPIIEIIIKESNETLPPQPLPVLSHPKKKEQVQVFYVKYQKDPKHGLIIEKPVAALSPASYHQENEDHEEHHTEEIYNQVTLSPPLQTTTLRTIIHPDSEKYHSDSGIRVTFGNHDKYSVETKEESLIQPVVAPAPQHNHFHGPTHGPVHFVQNTAAPRLGTQQPSNYYINHNQKYYKTNSEYRSFQQGPSQPAQEFGPSNNNYQSFPPPSSSFEVKPQEPQQPLQFLSNPPPQQYKSFVHEPVRHQYKQHEQFATGPSFNQLQFSQNQPQEQPHRLHSVSPPVQHPSKQFNNQPKPQTPQLYGTYQQLPFNNQQQPFRPIPIPLHISPSRPVAPSHSPPPTHQQLPSQQHSQQQFNNNGLRSFNNAQFEQPPTRHHLQHSQQYRRPLPPPPSQPFPPQQSNIILQQAQPQPKPQPSRQPSPQSQPKYNYNQIIDDFKPQQQSQFFQQNSLQIQGGGLVQQPPPNLGPGPALQHQQVYQNQQTQTEYNNHQQFSHHQQENSQFHPNQGIQGLIPEGEVIKSVSKYEQHITENVPFSYQQPLLSYNTNLELNSNTQKLKQAFESYSEQQKRPTQNIGPLAHSIGHLSQPTKQSSQSNQNNIQYHNHNYNGQNYYQNHSKPIIVAPSNPKPGQSVSTIYSEVFPDYDKQKQNIYSNNDPNIDIRSNFKKEFESIAAYNDNKQTQNKYESTHRTPSYQSSQLSSTTTSTTTQQTTKKPLNIELPDEVPDDLRQQLLSSGILDNADISILDYDKVGDINLENLPQEHLANFYGSGGAAQISSSNKVLTVVKPNGDKIGLKHNQHDKYSTDAKEKANENKSLAQKQNVDLKVVRFDSNSQKSVSDQYIKSNSKVLSPVNIDDQQYNRYLPLKINGAQFPIPDVDELRGKKVSSVVVLAPVDNVQSFDNDDGDNDGKDERVERDVIDSKQVKFYAGDALKQLIKKPSRDNYKKWLDREIKTDVDLQSVVLLVTNADNDKEQEIYMYDISSKTVNKLNGELSSAFVNVAEENAKTQDMEHATITDTGILEQLAETHRPNDDVEYDYDSRTGGESLSGQSNESQFYNKDLISQKTANKVLISSGYSVIKS